VPLAPLRPSHTAAWSSAALCQARRLVPLPSMLAVTASPCRREASKGACLFCGSSGGHPVVARLLRVPACKLQAGCLVRVTAIGRAPPGASCRADLRRHVIATLRPPDEPRARFAAPMRGKIGAVGKGGRRMVGCLALQALGAVLTA
jgi:hypothetical protein